MRTATSLAAAAALAAAFMVAWRRMRAVETKMLEMKRDAEKARVDAQCKEQQRQDERRGRVAAEKELRRVMAEKLDTSNGLYVQSLGHVSSCFYSCIGTPRQGLFAPSTRGKIVFQRNVSPDALVGLEHFSHVWIVFEFHKNTNGKNMRAHQGLRADSHRFTFKAKVSPPRLKERVGVFSTRSPHRPNPIGITLAKIESVDKASRVVHLSALDLIDGTPVLDIKPYVPAYDSMPEARVASWVSDDLSPTQETILWSEAARIHDLSRIADATRFYRNDPTSLRAAIEEVLLADVRSKTQTTRLRHAAQSELVFDNARVTYHVVSEKAGDDCIEVLGVETISGLAAISKEAPIKNSETMAASVGMLVDAADAKNKQMRTDDAEQHVDGGGSVVEAASETVQREARKVEGTTEEKKKLMAGEESAKTPGHSEASATAANDSAPPSDLARDIKIAPKSAEETNIESDRLHFSVAAPEPDTSESVVSISTSVDEFNGDETAEILAGLSASDSSKSESFVLTSVRNADADLKTESATALKPAAEGVPVVPSASESDESEPVAATSVLIVNGKTKTESATELKVESDGDRAALVKKSTPKGFKSKSANALGISTSKKKSKKKSSEKSHPSVGISVDALDREKRWGHGRILAVNVVEQRLKITFPGFSKSWDIWTDLLSIAPHGRHSVKVRYNSRSWDGQTNLFTGERLFKDEADECVSLNRLSRASVKRENDIAPSKAPPRIKKGYVLVPVVEDPAADQKPAATLKKEHIEPKRKLSSSSEGKKETKRPRVKQEALAAANAVPVNDPYSNFELLQQQANTESTMDTSKEFLSHCGELWKRQLLSMTNVQQRAFLVGDVIVADNKTTQQKK